MEIFLFAAVDFSQSVTAHNSIYSSGADKITINAYWIYANIRIYVYEYESSCVLNYLSFYVGTAEYHLARYNFNP